MVSAVRVSSSDPASKSFLAMAQIVNLVTKRPHCRIEYLFDLHTEPPLVRDEHCTNLISRRLRDSQSQKYSPAPQEQNARSLSAPHRSITFVPFAQNALRLEIVVNYLGREPKFVLMKIADAIPIEIVYGSCRAHGAACLRNLARKPHYMGSVKYRKYYP